MSKEIGHELGKLIKNGGDLGALVFVHLAQSEAFDDVTITEHPDVFAEWGAMIQYAASVIVWFKGALYRCVQAHYSQDDWTPDSTPALWTRIGDPSEEFPAWSQPIGAHDAYSVGGKVSFDDKHWVSTVDGNVWHPGVYGWSEVT
jgi:hypothetical protein